MISYEEYYPYGRSAYRAAASGVDLSLKRYRFTGKERDEETGLDYFGVRYYASWLGRWTSGDPGGFVDGLNLYRYVRNNPVNGIDREGYSTEEVETVKTCPPDCGCPNCPNNTPPPDNTTVVMSSSPPVEIFGADMTRIEKYRAANDLVLDGQQLPANTDQELSDIYNNTLDFYSNPFPNSLIVNDPSQFLDLYEAHIEALNSDNTDEQNRAITDIDLQDDYFYNNEGVGLLGTLWGITLGTVTLLKSLRGLRMVGADRLLQLSKSFKRSKSTKSSKPNSSSSSKNGQPYEEFIAPNAVNSVDSYKAFNFKFSNSTEAQQGALNHAIDNHAEELSKLIGKPIRWTKAKNMQPMLDNFNEAVGLIHRGGVKVGTKSVPFQVKGTSGLSSVSTKVNVFKYKSGSGDIYYLYTRVSDNRFVSAGFDKFQSMTKY